MEEGCFDLCPRRAPLLRYHVFPLFPSRPRRCHSAGATHGGGLFLRSNDFLWAIGRFVARNRQEKHCIVLQQNGHAKWTPRFQIVPALCDFQPWDAFFQNAKNLLVFFCRRRMHGMLHLQISEAGGSFSCLVDGTYSELPVLWWPFHVIFLVHMYVFFFFVYIYII